MELDNPFLVTGYHTSEYFCDREQETKTIIDALYNGRNVTLISPRRMGKTGLIHNVFYKLRENYHDIATFYIDIFPTQNLSDFVHLFASTILGQLDSYSQRSTKTIAKMFSSCRPVFTVDEYSGLPKVSIEIAAEQEEKTLKEIFEYLKLTKKRCYIAIDEFRQIAEYNNSGVEALLRSYIQFIPNVNFIFSGSREYIIQKMFLSAKRPFYQSTQMLTIGSIDKDIYYKFAANFFAKKKLELPEEVFECIYEKFEGHTWYVQNILNRLYAYRAKKATIKLVEQAVFDITSEMAYMYQSLLMAYSSNSVKLIIAIAKEGLVSSINSVAFISKYDLKATSSVNTIMEKLLEKEMVYRSEKGYILYDRFMAIWIRSSGF